MQLTCIKLFLVRNKWLASSQGKKMSPEESLFNQLKKLKEDDPNSVVVIHYNDETNVIQSIFFQTSYMRDPARNDSSNRCRFDIDAIDISLMTGRSMDLCHFDIY